MIERNFTHPGLEPQPRAHHAVGHEQTVARQVPGRLEPCHRHFVGPCRSGLAAGTPMQARRPV